MLGESLSQLSAKTRQKRRPYKNNFSPKLRKVLAVAFHGRFYGAKIFCCKTARFCVTPCECLTTETPSIRGAAQHAENMRKNSFLN
jgi:hypothetical protein